MARPVPAHQRRIPGVRQAETAPSRARPVTTALPRYQGVYVARSGWSVRTAQVVSGRFQPGRG